MRKFGYSRGALTQAAEEALRTWLASNGKEKMVFQRDPVKAIAGLLADIDMDSVELQHLATKFWAERLLGPLSRRH